MFTWYINLHYVKTDTWNVGMRKLIAEGLVKAAINEAAKTQCMYTYICAYMEADILKKIAMTFALSLAYCAQVILYQGEQTLIMPQ